MQKLERLPALGAPVVKVCLGQAVKQLEQDPAWAHGRSSRTLAKYPDFRAVLVAMKSGTSMEEHKAAGSIAVHVLAGRVRLNTGDQHIEIPADHVVMLHSELPHSVEALEDSAFLLTIAWRDAD